MTFVISADEIKKKLPGYSPEQSEIFHRESARKADKIFAQAIKDRKEKTVILLAGGTASGKSEYVSAYLRKKQAIVLDGTLPTFEGAKIKIRKAQKAGKQVAIHMVVPSSLLVAFIAFLNRERKFSVKHFYRTHSSSRKTLLEVAKMYEDVSIEIYQSNVNFVGPGATMRFQQITFADRGKLIEFLEKSQYTEKEIRDIVFKP